MYSVDETVYPLANVSQQDLANVCEALWDWRPCGEWVRSEECQQSSESTDGPCPCRRADRLEAFFSYYRNVSAYYVPELDGVSSPALRNQDDLVQLIRFIKTNADKPRSQLTKQYFGGRVQSALPEPPASDQNRAFNLATRIITMLQCGTENQSDGVLEAGMQPVMWHSNKSFGQFIHSAVPQRPSSALGPDDDVALSAKIPLTMVTAKRLRKVARLRIIATDNLANHLLLNEHDGTIAIYHFTSVLKEHLRASDTTGPNHINLPRQLALETLSTLKMVLFPYDPESQSLLRSLISKGKLDPDLQRVDSSIGDPISEDVMRFEYWGSRLTDLYDELENPTPRGFFEKWLERKSGSRYVMMATLVGVMIAIVLGIFSLAVSVFQAWVGWQQWQHPIQSS